MSKNSVKTSKTDNKKSLPVLWRRIIGILCAALVIGIIVSFVTFFKSQSADTISVSLQMSFDGAADGIAPNGYRFDVTELLSDEVLGKALKASSLDSKYTAEELRERGVNSSIIHVDFMIGTPDLQIDAVCENGTAVPVFRNGTWAF